MNARQASPESRSGSSIPPQVDKKRQLCGIGTDGSHRLKNSKRRVEINLFDVLGDENDEDSRGALRNGEAFAELRAGCLRTETELAILLSKENRAEA